MSKKRNVGGRPRKPAEERKTKRERVYFSSAELTRVELASTLMHIPRARFNREAILSEAERVIRQHGLGNL